MRQRSGRSQSMDRRDGEEDQKPPVSKRHVTNRNQADPKTGQSRWLWLPMVLIAVALVLILAAPLLVGTRVQSLRQHEGNVLAPALVRVNDLEAAVGAETAARSEEAEKTVDRGDADQAARSARATEEKDLDSLGMLVREAGPDAALLFADARAAIDSWKRQEDEFVKAGALGQPDDATAGSLVRTKRWKSVETAFAAVQRLDDDLANRSSVELAEIARLERFNDFVPAVLVPLALIGLAALGWMARRTRELSRQAAAGRAAAEHALASKSALMRGVTHDLKNPLGAARGYADLIADGVIGPVTPAQAEIIGRLRNLIDVTLDTVNDLLELSRAEAGMLSVELHDTDIAAVTREVVSDYEASATKAGISLVLDDQTGKAGPIIRTDSSRVREVLGNLLSNAVKYTPAGGSAKVRIKHDSDPILSQVVEILVSDDGPGIPADMRESVFEEFFRVPSTPSSVKGSGVGLAIARRIARLLGGDLRLADSENGGAAFSLILPAQPAG
jgi:signal transduction histidine kinase